MSSYLDVNDDLAIGVKPFKIAAVMPVFGRLPLLELTINRLYQKNKVDVVICVGDGMHEKKLCKWLGCDWVNYRNKPLGAKWNKGFIRAKELNVDACLYIGSSDWICDDWITIMRPHMERHQMVGTPGCHFLDIAEERRLVNWKGYTGERENESIGIGRMLSAKLLDDLKWQPFNDIFDNSLDRSMKDNAMKYGIRDYMIRDERLKAVSISTKYWPNKHKFDHHWLDLLPSEKIKDVDGFLKDYFPEALAFKYP